MNIFESQLAPMKVFSNRARQKFAQWGRGEIDGRSTGFVTLDPMLRLCASELTLIAARTSQGKTALAMQMVENVAQQLQEEDDPGCVAVYSAEMSGTQLIIRMVGALAGVDTHRYSMGKGTPEDTQKIQAALSRVERLPIWIDDSSRPSTRHMLERLEALHEDTPVRMMMFDFVELGGDDGKTEELRLSSIYQHLKGIAKTLEIPVLALSQVNREVEKRKNKMPALSDLRGSGMGEQVADKIVFIMRPEYYLDRGESVEMMKDEDKKGIAYIQVAKNRNGPVGMVRMGFRKVNSKFADLNVPTIARTVNTNTAILQPPTGYQTEQNGDILWA